MSLAEEVKAVTASLWSFVEFRCQEAPLERGSYPPHEITITDPVFLSSDTKDKRILLGLINQALAGEGFETDRSQLPMLAEDEQFARFDLKGNEIILTTNDLFGLNEKFYAIAMRIDYMAERIEQDANRDTGRG